MAQSKATKKFEKRHLKDTLERRKGVKQVKQKQQLKQKKKARRAEENGRSEQEGLEERAPKGQKASSAFNEMSVDEFFQGGFEIPDEPVKQNGRKRTREDIDQTSDSSDGGDSLQHEPVVGDDQLTSDSEDDFEAHKQQLDALAANDPEFHKYLKENEPELLDGNLEEVAALSEDETEEPKRKKQRRDDTDDEDDGILKSDLKASTVKKWATAMSEKKSLRAARETVLAFRAAVHGAEDDEKDFKYTISSPEVYHLLLTTALKHVPEVLQHHVPVQESKTGKTRITTEDKKFRTLAPLLKSHVLSIIQLLDNLSDPAALAQALKWTLPVLPYLLSFKQLVRGLARAVTDVWSSNSNTEAVRVAAFLVLRRLTIIGDPGIRENMLKSVYQGFIKSCRNTTIHTIAGVNLMKNSAAELWGIDTSVGYTTGFTFIRQLAIHLRSSITNNSNDSYKTVYNWQFVHSLDFWSRVLASHCTSQDSQLQPLIYPLVQVTVGAMRLIPTATYFPLRFQLIRALLRVSMSTGTYIPLAAPLFEVLNSAEMRKAPKPSTLKPLEFSTAIRAAKSYLRTRTYQDGVGEQVQELLSEFFGLWTKSIAFPELALPVIVMVKRWLKDVNNRAPGTGNKNQKVNGMISLLVQKLEANSTFIEEKRAKVEFAPNNRKGVESFLQDLEWDKTPLGAYLSGQRRQREERVKLVEASRRDEERRARKDRAEVETEQIASEASMSDDDE